MVTLSVASDSRERDGEGGRPFPPTVKDLFVGFFVLGVTGFGGVLPLAREAVVVRRRWMSDSEFLDLLGLCQLLPGGNIINLAFAIGMHFRGVRGAMRRSQDCSPSHPGSSSCWARPIRRSATIRWRSI